MLRDEPPSDLRNSRAKGANPIAAAPIWNFVGFDQRFGMIGGGIPHAVDVFVDNAHPRHGKARFHDEERRLNYQSAGDVLSFNRSWPPTE